jgi:hypothetical protein
MNSRKRFKFILFFIFAMVFTITACQPAAVEEPVVEPVEEPEAEEVEEAEPGPAVITYWYTMSDPETAQLENVVAAFESATIRM